MKVMKTPTRSSGSGGIWGHWDDAVLESVEVDDTDGELRHGVEAPEGGAAHGAHRGEGGGHPLQDPGPDEHPAIGHPGYMDHVGVNAEPDKDKIVKCDINAVKRYV